MQSGFAVDLKLGGVQVSLRRFGNHDWHRALVWSVR